MKQQFAAWRSGGRRTALRSVGAVMFCALSIGCTSTGESAETSSAIAVVADSGSAASDTLSEADRGPCVTDRSVIPSTTCTPTAAQVERAADITIPADAQGFESTYEQALDWRLTATFTVTVEQAAQYESIDGYSATVVGGEPATSTGQQGEQRALSLQAEGDRVRVSFIAYTM
jgi:hypothetical protein